MDDQRRTPAFAGLFLALLLGMASTPIAAQDVRFGSGGWALGAYTGMLNDEPEFEPEQAGDQMANDAIYGLRAGYVLPSNLFLEGDVAVSFPEVQLRDGGPRIPTRTWLFGGSAGYAFQPTRELQIMVSAGAEAVSWDLGASGSETDFGLRYGTGARYYLAPNVAIRGDLRWHQVRDALQDSRAIALGVPAAAEEDLWAMEISGGISIFLGGPRDSDGDGVYDEVDACPDTASDRIIVDERGCAVDGDMDGVPDGLDRCPRTARGATVDGEGCPSDSDGDMILDGLDECPNTPARATVDDRGCSTDSDRDGVLDGLDRCPDTPEGAEVDEFGCPTGALGVVLSDFVSELDRLTVWFDVDSAELWEDSQPALDLLGEALVQNPDVVIDVEGHTDSTGPEDYNEELSQERAEAVRTYLAENFPEIEADQIGVTALGETSPTASNDTPEGRQRNRRAVVVVVEPLPEN